MIMPRKFVGLFSTCSTVTDPEIEELMTYKTPAITIFTAGPARCYPEFMHWFFGKAFNTGDSANWIKRDIPL